MAPIVFDVAYNTAYNAVYYSLSAASLLLLIYTVFLGFKKRRKIANPTHSNQALGMSLTALGFAVIIFSGVFLDTLTKNGVISDLLFQQLHFSIFYVGVALMLFGIDASLQTVQKSFQDLAKNPHVKQLRILLWGVFITTMQYRLFTCLL